MIFSGAQEPTLPRPAKSEPAGTPSNGLLEIKWSVSRRIVALLLSCALPGRQKSATGGRDADGRARVPSTFRSKGDCEYACILALALPPGFTTPNTASGDQSRKQRMRSRARRSTSQRT